MSVNSKMTALADEIRELSGTTDTKSLDEMKADVDAANAEIAEQAELIAQIATVLEGKASGVEDIGEEIAEYTSLNAELEAVISSLPEAGGSGGNVETCTIKVIDYLNYSRIVTYTAYSNGVFTSVSEGNIDINFDGTLENVVCGSAVYFPGDYIYATCTDGVVDYSNAFGVFYTAPLTANTVATITLVPD